MLIVDQINVIASKFRNAHMLFLLKGSLDNIGDLHMKDYLIGRNNNRVRLDLRELHDYSLYNSSVNIEQELIFPEGNAPIDLK